MKNNIRIIGISSALVLWSALCSGSARVNPASRTTPPAKRVTSATPVRSSVSGQQSLLAKKRKEINEKRQKLQAQRVLLQKQRAQYARVPRGEKAAAARVRLKQLESIDRKIQTLQKQQATLDREEKTLVARVVPVPKPTPPARPAPPKRSPEGFISALRPATEQERQREEDIEKFREKAEQEAKNAEKKKLEDELAAMRSAERKMLAGIADLAKQIRALEAQRLETIQQSREREDAGGELTLHIINMFDNQQRLVHPLLNLQRDIRLTQTKLAPYQPRSAPTRPTSIKFRKLPVR